MAAGVWAGLGRHPGQLGGLPGRRQRVGSPDRGAA
jgi:hypothetical protein